MLRTNYTSLRKKYVDRNSPHTLCYLCDVVENFRFPFFFFFSLLFFFRGQRCYAKVIRGQVEIRGEKSRSIKSAIPPFKQIWFSTKWNFRGEPKISVEKRKENRENLATWIHPWNSHKSLLEFLSRAKFLLTRPAFSIIRHDRLERGRKREKTDEEWWLFMNHSWSPWKCWKTNLSSKQKFVSEQTCIFHGEAVKFLITDLANDTAQVEID